MKPVTPETQLAAGQLLVHRDLGVCSFRSLRTIGGKEVLDVRFSGDYAVYVPTCDQDKIQVLYTDEGVDQPLRDQIGRRPKEWQRFLVGVKAGTIFHHYLSPILPESALSSGQLVRHVQHGVAEYRDTEVQDGSSVWNLEFANGWRTVIPASERDSLQIIHIDPASGRRPELDQYPKRNLEWERFLIRERGRLRSKVRTELIQEATRIGIKESVRHEVWRRDGGKCVRCQSRVKLEFDHIVPVSKGGSDTARNIELLCETCNRKKGARI